MTHQSSRAYACVAYRIMEYEGQEMSEEYLSLLMEMLYDFYTESEIKKVYLDNVRLDASITRKWQYYSYKEIEKSVEK